jgi:hypothetical protein
VNFAAIGGGRTFSFFGRTALVLASVPYVRANVSGLVEEQPQNIKRSGLVDPRMKFSVNLVGGRALTPQEFATAKRSTIVGASLTVVAPLGQYDPHKLINLSVNRWAFKSEAGYSKPVNNWTFDVYGGVWLFTKNHEFFPGSSVRTQERILTLQGHTSYTIKPRWWVAIDATWYSGGSTSVNGMSEGTSQSNVRVGATVSVPLTRRQSLKADYSKGTITRIGSDFTTISAAWQLRWFD